MNGPESPILPLEIGKLIICKSGKHFVLPPNCNSMPFGAAWAYYGEVLVLASVAS